MIDENKAADLILGARFAHLGRRLEDGLDCLGVVVEFYRIAYGIDLSKNISDGWHDVANPNPGDVAEIRFYQSRFIDHCAVYLGNGMMLHATQNSGVIRSKVSTYQSRIVRWMRHESRSD